MKRLVVFPSDPMQAYLDLGQTYEYFYDYFNPGGFFDEVYALSPWGDNKREMHNNVTYIRDNPKNFSKTIKEIAPSVIRAYGGYWCADWLAMNIIDGIPNVISVHDTNPDLIYSTIKYADNIIYMAKCVQDAVRKKIDCTNKGEWILGNRIDTNLFSVTKDTVLSDQLTRKFGKGRHVLHVGRKCKQKNLDTLIKAIKFLPADVSVIFIGRGDFSEFEQLAIEEKVSERVFNVDHVNNTDLPKWYSWCDAFCTPSRWEGFGFVFIEAASCQVPIVTSNIGPMNEYLTNGKDSILVDDYENPKEIAKAIIYALENKDEVSKLCTNARAVGNRFAKESVDKQEIAIYEQIIKNGPRNRLKMPPWSHIKLKWKYHKY